MTINAQDVTMRVEAPSGVLTPLLSNYTLVAEPGSYGLLGVDSLTTKFAAGTPTVGNLWNADFEDFALGALAQGTSGFGDAFDWTTAENTHVYAGTQAAESFAEPNMPANGFGKWGGDHNFTNQFNDDETWWRIWLRFETNWEFGSGPKQLRVLRSRPSGPGAHADIFFSGSWFDVHMEGGNLPAETGYPGGGLNLRIPVDMNGLRGQWFCVEQYFKWHTDRFQADRKVWLNGDRIFNAATGSDIPGAKERNSSDPWNSAWQHRTIPWSDGWADIFRVHGTWNDPQNETTPSQRRFNQYDEVIATSNTPNDVDSFGFPFIGLSTSNPVVNF